MFRLIRSQKKSSFDAVTYFACFQNDTNWPYKYA